MRTKNKSIAMRLPKFISFTSDYGFKVTFGNEKNTLFLKRALQALIQSPIPITDITFDKTTFEGIDRDSRSGIYDISCTDEMNNHFIIEMQVSTFKFFMQRLKFYGFHKFDTLVQKGDYKYDNLTKIYCIAILANSITPFKDYHNIGNIKNQNGEVMDEQITFVTIELPKFNKVEKDCQTDLEKLLFTMKALSQVEAPTKYPKFWTEEWIGVAIKELETRKLSKEDRFAYLMTLNRNAEAVYTANENIKVAVEAAVEAAVEVEKKKAAKVLKISEKKAAKALELAEKKAAETELKTKQNTVKLAIQAGLDFNIIAKINEVSLDFVNQVNAKIKKKQEDFTSFLSI